MAEANAPFGSIYHHFPNGKAQLGEEVIRRSGQMYKELFEAIFDAAPDVATATSDFFLGAAETLRQTDYADACPIETVALEVASTNEPLRKATAAVFESWIAAGTRAPERGRHPRVRGAPPDDRVPRRARGRVRPVPRDEDDRGARGRRRADDRHGARGPGMTVDAGDEQLLLRAYEAFNARDIEAAIALMHPDVDWPNAMEGTRVHGHDGVRDYWTRQFETIQSRVEPRGFAADPDGRVVVDVHQVVRDTAGVLLADTMVQHVYTIRDGLVTRMDVRD